MPLLTVDFPSQRFWMQSFAFCWWICSFTFPEKKKKKLDCKQVSNTLKFGNSACLFHPQFNICWDKLWFLKSNTNLNSYRFLGNININYDVNAATVHIFSIFQKRLKLFFDIFAETASINFKPLRGPFPWQHLRDFWGPALLRVKLSCCATDWSTS